MIINSTETFVDKKQNWNIQPNSENTRTEYSENDGFVQNASLSGFISNRPVFNRYPDDPRATTPITAGSFENVRLNIPDYNIEFNGTYPQETKNLGKNKINAVKGSDFSIVNRRYPFKETCGMTFADNKVTGGKVAEIGQFPWMALLAFRRK